MKLQNPRRLAAAIAIAVVLAALLAAQSISSVTTRSAPILSTRLMSNNGAAFERAAFEKFTAQIEDLEDLETPADASALLAQQALYYEPLSPRAIAILSLSEKSDAHRTQLLEVGARINRRDLTLQGLVLKDRLARGEQVKGIGTLDQILRVRPRLYGDFFAIFVSAMEDEDSIPEFARILDDSSDWHRTFLVYAVRQPGTLGKLAQLRRSLTWSEPEFDRRLIAGLARIGSIDDAIDIYEKASARSVVFSTPGRLDWNSLYPPFEWRLIDEPGFRAQVLERSDQLELALRPGNGGILAERVIASDGNSFRIRIAHDIQPTDQLRDVKLELRCADRADTFLVERFSPGINDIEVLSIPPDCEYIALAINARAWSGRSALSGTINKIEIVPTS